MDLIYTDARHVDQGVLAAYSLDLDYGAGTGGNNFELTIGKAGPLLEKNALIYIDGTEYGGIVDGMRSSSHTETRVSLGRTWHGILDSKVIAPDAGADYLTVTGDANDVLDMLIARLGLSDLFRTPSTVSGITITNYQFPRYIMGYTGIRDMLNKYGAKPKIRWKNGMVELTAELIADYTNSAVDGDEAVVTVERNDGKVNHLICLGQGDLADRMVLHLYVDQFGRIGETQYYTGLDEIVDVYENVNAADEAELREEGIERLEEVRKIDNVDVTVHEGSDLEYDVGDIISGKDTTTGNTAQAVVTQKVVRIQNGAISIDYKTDVKAATVGNNAGAGTGGNSTATVSPVFMTSISLPASAWVGSGNLYSQVVAIDGITDRSQVNLTPSVEQLSAFYYKDITFITENDGGVVTIYVIGQKPENDYIIPASIVEVRT